MRYLAQHPSSQVALLLTLATLCGAPGPVLAADAVTTWSTLECAASRVWAGVHFRTASDAGQHLGEAIANYVVKSLLRPVGENGKK